MINHVGTGEDSTTVTTNVLAHTVSIVEDGQAQDDSIPEETVDENVYGLPTVKIRRLVKTVKSKTVMNNMSMKMYANQIFTLLGQNGSGKVSFFLFINTIKCSLLSLYLNSLPW